MGVVIRDLTRYDEFLEVRDIQQRCWGFGPDEGLYPPMLATAARSGGTVLGAVDGDRLIGFLFGFLGLHPGHRLKLCSQTMGILPEYRNRGVGAALKWAQRERVLALGIDLITWTYDPLEAPNARLNLHTLGAIGGEYQRDLYGEDFGALGRGLPSDRILVEWWLNSERVLARSRGEPAEGPAEGPVVNRCEGMVPGQRIASIDLGLEAPYLRLEIPADMQFLKAADIALARDWRLQARVLFEAYFERGYCAVDLLAAGAGPDRRNFYVLKRNCHPGSIDLT